MSLLARMAACTWRYPGGHIDLGAVAARLASFIGLVLDTPGTTPDPPQAAGL